MLLPLADEHLEDLVVLNSDPKVLRYLSSRAPTRVEIERDFQRRLARAGQIDGLGQWAGYRGGEFVGLWMLNAPHGPSQPKVPGEADLGYRVLRRFWRQGLAREGSRELLRHGFDDLHLNRIFAQTLAVNVASRSTMESLGMRYVRSFHEDDDDPVPGSEHGEVEYEVRREQWQEGRA